MSFVWKSLRSIVNLNKISKKRTGSTHVIPAGAHHEICIKYFIFVFLNLISTRVDQEENFTRTGAFIEVSAKPQSFSATPAWVRRRI